MDRTIPGNALRLIKGEDHAMGLERLSDMARRYDSTSNNELFALVNGNFWRAVRNTMIGPCVIDGEVVELNAYKHWTSAFIDVQSKVTIDTIALAGTIRLGGRVFSISSVNRRGDSGVVVYNSFGGQAIPHVSAKEIEKAFHEAVKDSVFQENDSTEAELTKDVLKNEIARAQREANVEYPMVKVRVRYLRSPSVNVPFPCQVLGVDTGTVTMPLRGAVVSFPRSVLNGYWPKAGDTLTLAYTTSKYSTTRFMNAVCGTPRLVRSGVAKHEAQAEGSTGRRFIQENLARTALGVDHSGNRIVLAAIRPDRPEDGTSGATLQQVAQIMAILGCYDAMNLDGGGSAGMVIGNDHVFFDGADPLTRRLGLGVGVVKLSKILRGPR
ncbi:MAG: phosphodiester glycosidase family protein [Candidatus Kapabacteria bacterium]|nr:phosphodiester glycosidase family protein [Candidatus Kapabacteria bacterium]